MTSDRAAGDDASVLDCEQLRTERLLQGLSVRELASRLGVSATTIHGLESARNHREIRLGFLCALADELAVHPTSLFRGQGQTAVAPTVDATAVEVALTIVGRPIDRHALATALGWTAGRAAEALGQLATFLDDAGCRLHTDGWGKHRIMPRRELLSKRQRGDLARLATAATGLSVHAARVLRRAAEREITPRWLSHASPGELAALSALLRQELVRVDDAGGVWATARALEGLGVEPMDGAPPDFDPDASD